MNKIHVMSSILANKIAAGEVVEKIASVVKELVENSIDAKSTEIKIELKESGISEIIVTDNGEGMNSHDAKLAFERHATSKLLTDDDLFNINTLGFRGEALPSIASVSKISLETCDDNESLYIEYEAGKLIKEKPGVFRRGTKISVKNLFYNTPARLKHMKSLYAEVAYVSDFINKIALANPNIKFILQNDGKTLLNTDGKNNLLKTISDVFGMEVAKKMFYIEGDNYDYMISGFVSMPEVNKSNRNSMVTIVNNRVVRNNELNRYINDAYKGYKPDNRYPIIVLNINTDPSLIDVNIHPTKMDIKFSKLDKLGEYIKLLIEESLGKETLIPKVTKEEIKEVLSSYEEQTLNFDFVKEETTTEPTKEKVKEEPNIVEEPKVTMPKLYPVGLVLGSYIVCQNDEGMYLVDQHAAKERINYELYKNKMSNPNQLSTELTVPITLEYQSSEFIILNENIDVIKSLGFEIEEFGINSFIIKSHPVWLPSNKEEEATNKIMETILNYEKGFKLEKFIDNAAINLSCKMSIKANTNISINEMESLVDELRNCSNPYNCPHGRPTVVSFSTYELEKMFKRTGF